MTPVGIFLFGRHGEVEAAGWDEVGGQLKMIYRYSFGILRVKEEKGRGERTI